MPCWGGIPPDTLGSSLDFSLLGPGLEAGADIRGFLLTKSVIGPYRPVAGEVVIRLSSWWPQPEGLSPIV